MGEACDIMGKSHFTVKLIAVGELDLSVGEVP